MKHEEQSEAENHAVAEGECAAVEALKAGYDSDSDCSKLPGLRKTAWPANRDSDELTTQDVHEHQASRRNIIAPELTKN